MNMRLTVVGFVEEQLGFGDLHDGGDQEKGDDKSKDETENQFQVDITEKQILKTVKRWELHIPELGMNLVN
jgi:hypothetical protein